MLRLPAANAAVIAWAATATNDNICKTVSVGGRVHIENLTERGWNPDLEIKSSGSIMHRLQDDPEPPPAPAIVSRD
jgi:hypothetical protein